MAATEPLTTAITTMQLLLGLLLLLHGRYRGDEVRRLNGLSLVICALLGSALVPVLPAGECCPGFLCSGGWWIWRSGRPRWAHVSLALGVSLGAAIGFQGLAAGAYPVSDLFFSAAVSLILAHMLFERLRPITPRTLSLLMLLVLAIRLPIG